MNDMKEPFGFACKSYRFSRKHTFMFSISKPYGFELETVRSQYGNRTVFI